MQCAKCENKAVYKSQGLVLCKNHFLEHVESKVFKTIKKYRLLEEKDKVCIAASGGKDSLVALYLSAKYCKNYDIEYFALAIDEGIAGYRDHTIDDLKLFCKKHDIKLHVASFKDKVGSTLDQIRDKAIKQLNKKPCTVCGILRRTYLNRGARELKATKLVTGHNLDDESQSFLMNVLLGNMKHNASMGPSTGLQANDKFVPRVKPLYLVSEQETRLFCLLKGFKVNFNECPNIGLSFRAKVRDQLNELEFQNPGAKNGIVNSFLEILPDLKEKYKHYKPFDYCKKCGDPCSGDMCNACRLEKELVIS